jgi:hypothetical protein
LEAVKEGLSAMPNEFVVYAIKGDTVRVLKELGVKNITVSRRMIETHKKLFTELNKNNIKTYAFHVNFDIGRDEAYAVYHDLEYV